MNLKSCTALFRKTFLLVMENGIWFHLPGDPLGGWKSGKTHRKKAKIISQKVDHLREFFLSLPPVASVCDHHQLKKIINKNKNNSRYLFYFETCLNCGSSRANVHWVNVFSTTVSATLLYIPTLDHVTPPSFPLLLPAAGSADVTSIDKNVGGDMALRVEARPSWWMNGNGMNETVLSWMKRENCSDGAPSEQFSMPHIRGLVLLPCCAVPASTAAEFGENIRTDLIHRLTKLGSFWWE